MLPSRSSKVHARSSRKRRLLVVDDEEENLEIVSRAFHHEFEIYTARDGDEALILARQIRPDVIITDQRMPNMTGTEFLAHIQKELPETARVLVTGYTDYNSLVEAVNKSSVHHYFEKPFHTVDLKTVVDGLVQNQELKDQATRDGLTGLFNYRYLFEQLQIELARSKRYRRKFSLVFLDIDDFKQVNDRFGHGVGDEVLCAISRLLEAPHGMLRSSDFSARYGGEEFCLVLPETPLAGGKIKAERIRSAVVAIDWTTVHPQMESRVTISVGVAAYPNHGDTVEALIAAADAAQYEAKRQGKNRVATAGEETCIVMAVDDEPDNLDLIVRTLSDYDVRVFTDSVKALEEAIKIKPEVLVLDYRMPEINGVEFVRRCRRQGVNSPALMVTAFRELDEVVYAEQDKLIYQVIPKPFNPSRLQDWVQLAIMENNSPDRSSDF